MIIFAQNQSITFEHIAAVKEMADKIKRVRELHKDDSTGNCTTCMETHWTPHKVALPMPYPCPTIQALDGEQE